MLQGSYNTMRFNATVTTVDGQHVETIAQGEPQDTINRIQSHLEGDKGRNVVLTITNPCVYEPTEAEKEVEKLLHLLLDIG